MTGVVHHDGLAPGQSPIGRAADEHIDFGRIPIGGDTQVRGQPDPVPGVKGHGCIADGRIDARRCGGCGGVRQEATGKALPTIGGGSESDIGSAATKDAAHLEDGKEARASGKGIRFDLRSVLARAVGKGVATELEESHTGKG